MLRRLSIAILASALIVASAPAEKLRFVVAGDGRADFKPREGDFNGLNKVITTEIAQAVVAEKASFLMWTGDLVKGYEKEPSEFEKQLLTWRGIMEPLYKKHIKVLACRGNHEAGSQASWTVWNKVFSGDYAMPSNGPSTEKGLTFYYEQGPILAIGLDQYVNKGEAIAQPWLDNVLARHTKPFIFAMGHEPAFMDGSHKDTMDASPEARDAFWNSLTSAGSRVFFCGHDHLYDHMAVVREGAKPGPEMHQFVAGTAGAPFYKQGDYAGNNIGWKLRRVKHIDETYGYIVVDINGKKATITFKGRTSPGHYVPMDTYSYTVG